MSVGFTAKDLPQVKHRSGRVSSKCGNGVSNKNVARWHRSRRTSCHVHESDPATSTTGTKFLTVAIISLWPFSTIHFTGIKIQRPAKIEYLLL